MSLKNNNTAYFYYMQGLDNMDNGDLDLAVIDFRKSITIDKHFKTYQKLAEALEKLELHEESFKALEIAYSLNPQNDKTAMSLALYLYENKDYNKAVKLANEIIERNPTYTKAIKLLKKLENSR